MPELKTEELSSINRKRLH